MHTLCHIVRILGFIENGFRLFSNNFFLFFTFSIMAPVLHPVNILISNWINKCACKYMYTWNPMQRKRLNNIENFNNCLILFSGKHIVLSFIVRKDGKFLDWIWSRLKMPQQRILLHLYAVTIRICAACKSQLLWKVKFVLFCLWKSKQWMYFYWKFQISLSKT